MTSKRKEQSAFSAAKWMTGSSYVAFVTGFVGNIFITKALGPEAYGIYSYLIWMVTISVGLTSGGLNITTIRFISEAIGAKEPDQANALFAWLRQLLWIGVVLMLSLLAITLCFPAVYPSAVSEEIYLYLGFTGLCAVLKSAYLFDASASKGYAIFYTEAVTNSTIGMMTVCASAVLYLCGQGLNAYLMLFAISSLLQPLIARQIMRRHQVTAHPGPIPDELKARAWGALRWNVALSLVGMLSTKSADTYLLGLQSLTAYVGYYNIASSLTKSGLDLLTSGFSSMLLPFISRAGAEGGREKIQQLFSGSVRFYQFAGILVAGGAYIMSESMVMFLYGPAYREVIPALRVMALVGGMLLPNAAYSAVFIATDHHRARMVFIILSAVISIITSVTFIPWLGYKGALISIFAGNVGTYLLVAATAHVGLKIYFPIKAVMLQWLSAALPFAALVWMLPPHSSLPLSILATFVFGAAFVFISLNIGAWHPEDIAMLRQKSTFIDRMLKTLMVGRIR
jgi:O-antigen/teichoic acid export membrane protein